MNIELVYGLDDLGAVVKKLNAQLNNCSILVLKGSLGAGKTTLVKALLENLGVKPEDITSPTFTYINRYKLKDGRVCNHFDLYRLNDLGEFLEMGFDEYLNQRNTLTLIEWPEIIKPLLDEYEGVCMLTLDYRDDETRELTFTKE